MYLLGSSIVLVLAFISSVTEARPDLVDSVIGAISDVVYDDCQEISDPNVCAIVYDDEDCGQGDLAWISSSLTWEPLKIGIGESKSFSLLKDLSHLYKYKNDIESFVVRKGCTLKVYKDSDWTDSEYIFTAPNNQDLIVKDLESSSATEYLDNDIESLRCNCE